MRRIFLILVFCYFFVSGSVVLAFDAWFIDTRGGFEIDQLDKNSRWKTSTLDAFIQTHDSDKPLVIVTHGYKMTYKEAKQFGINFSRLTRKFGDHRFLFWSWDADKEMCGIKSDAINAGKKADSEAKHLVNFLRRLKSGSKVSLVGFSYGARLISVALHEFGADRFKSDNSQVPNDNLSSTIKINVIFLAAAVDRDQFGQNKKYGNMLSVVDKLLININVSDPALYFYPLLSGVGSPKAVGRRGINVSGIPKNLVTKIKSIDVRPEIGVDHTFISSFQALLTHKKKFKNYALFD
ncbi:MAG: alpha/beta hydrolase [Planctomycetaceae bacterium]|jgi:esterase/lipase superfamily enzyme|nr:alpha/beta hydrolase [Planctomycetaceae bacterium]